MLPASRDSALGPSTRGIRDLAHCQAQYKRPCKQHTTAWSAPYRRCSGTAPRALLHVAGAVSRSRDAAAGRSGRAAAQAAHVSAALLERGAPAARPGCGRMHAGGAVSGANRAGASSGAPRDAARAVPAGRAAAGGGPARSRLRCGLFAVAAAAGPREVPSKRPRASGALPDGARAAGSEAAALLAGGTRAAALARPGPAAPARRPPAAAPRPGPARPAPPAAAGRAPRVQPAAAPRAASGPGPARPARRRRGARARLLAQRRRPGTAARPGPPPGPRRSPRTACAARSGARGSHAPATCVLPARQRTLLRALGPTGLVGWLLGRCVEQVSTLASASECAALPRSSLCLRGKGGRPAAR